MIFGIGTDIAGIRRMGDVLARHGDKLALRMLAREERQEYGAARDKAVFLAKRFAAKEAVGKALGIGIIGFVWRDIEVLSGGKPLIALHGDVARIAAHLGVTRIEVSLSHTGGMAYAVAAALKEDADG